jgi:hypothetical protein
MMSMATKPAYRMFHDPDLTIESPQQKKENQVFTAFGVQ